VYTLRLLGSPSIEGSDGTVVGGRPAQGRQLALLALLALAPGRALSRDKLVTILWPESSAVRARPQLSDTVYVLRHALGEDVLRSAADGLALNAERVTSDVGLFEQLLDEGRLEEAVGRWRGPLLDGFHVSGSVEFETWLAGERARLERLYSRALEKLAGDAEARGDVEAALGWWRRRATHDPHNGHAALQFMRALDAAGDRAGALQHARIHAILLREEFDAEPDAELTAFAERLRQDTASAPPGVDRFARAHARETARALAPPPTPTAIPAQASAPTPASAPAPAPASAPALPPAMDADPPPSPLAAIAAPQADPWPLPAGRRRLAVAAALVLTVTLGIALAWGVMHDDEPALARSVGVLPFINMSPDPANTYFSDGLSEQVILALSRIDGLRVAARTSSFALRNRELDVRAIADTLDVHAVLEGSVLVHGERLRVIAQLIDARTGFHIWSEQYDGDLHDAFALQDSIAIAIADALHLRLAGTRAPAAAQPSFEAYDYYFRGLYLRRTLAPDALVQAAEYFDRAIALEPRFAQAWAAKASVIAPQAYFRYANRDSVVAELRVLTRRALELDPQAGEAHAALGVLRLFYEWDWAGAEAALRRAIELNPNDAHAWHHLANYQSAMGEMSGAVAAREKAVQLDPLNARTRVVLSRDYLITGNYDAALEQGRRAAQLDAMNPLLLGRGPTVPAGAAEVLLRQGHAQEAVEEYIRLATLRGATPAELQAMRDGYTAAGMTGFWKAWLAMDVRQSGPSPDPVRMAATHLLAGDTARAFDWLDRALDERSPGLIYLHRYPGISGLRAHPRIERIARVMRLPG
jgi:TolB-like protein/DNA-binding SARP family transcriptional activator/Flp pilus assembly protein TadD